MSTPYGLSADALKVKPFEWNEHYDIPRDLVGYGEESFNPQCKCQFSETCPPLRAVSGVIALDALLRHASAPPKYSKNSKLTPRS